MSTELVIVSPDDLALVENNALNAKQLQMLLKTTPRKFVKSRPAKGGGQWAYVSGGYVRKVLNLMFGWDWDFEICKVFSDWLGTKWVVPTFSIEVVVYNGVAAV